VQNEISVNPLNPSILQFTLKYHGLKLILVEEIRMTWL